MSALAHLLRCDFAIQTRHGFWLAAAFALTPWVVILLLLSREQSTFLLPLLIFGEISTAGPLFMAGSYFFDKRDGSLQAISVTPIRTWQWIAAKLISLSAIGTAMCVTLVLVGAWDEVAWGRVLIGIVCVNLLYSQCGFILAAPCDRFTDYFLYYVPTFAILGIPALVFVDIEHPLFWILPTQPTLVLIRSAFDNTSFPRFVGVLAIQLVWIASAHALCLRAFRRNIADRKGA